MKIVHLVVDDKFIDRAIREFDAVDPGLHEFLILDTPRPFRYLRSNRVRCVDGPELARALAGDVQAVVFHCLSPAHVAALGSVPEGPTVVWIGWGYDYYGLLADAFPNGLLLPQTARCVAQLQPRQTRCVPGQLSASVLSVSRPCAKPTRHDIEQLRRVDFFCPVIEDEYHLVRRHQPWFRAEYMPWNYGTMEDDLVVGEPRAGGPGRHLLVGNSATSSNNHIDAFDLIRRRVDLQDRKVVVPLSYGDPGYAAAVVRAGRQAFGDAFVPLTRFMEREAYFELLSSCGIVVMNHVRQQAVGNVMISALLGARLFLNRCSPLYGWLQRKGFEIDDINDLHTTPLSEAQRAGNRQAVTGFSSRARRRQQTRRLVDAALQSAVAEAG